MVQVIVISRICDFGVENTGEGRIYHPSNYVSWNMRDQRPCSIAVRIFSNLCHASGSERCTDFLKKNV
jgi:hypothetical protein